MIGITEASPDLEGREAAQRRRILGRMRGRRPQQNAVGALVRTLRLLSSGFPLQQVLETLLDVAIDLSGAGRGFLVLRTGEGFSAEVVRDLDRAAPDGEFSRTVVSSALASGQPVLTTSALDDPRFSGAASVQAMDLRSVMCVPFRLQDGGDGALYLDNRLMDGVFGPDDLDLISGLAAQAAGVLSQHRALESQRRLRHLLDRYVSPQVAQELLARPDLALRGHRQEVTSMFSDIRGFTTWASGEDPDFVLKGLNRYYERLVDIVFSHRGTVASFMGDGVLILFGAPVPDEKQATQAVQAAREIIQAAPEFGFQVGVGLSTGDVVVGDVGSESRRDFGAIGHSTNVAARIEKLTGSLGRPILMTEATWRKSGSHGEFVGEHTLKGVEEPVRLYTPSAS